MWFLVLKSVTLVELLSVSCHGDTCHTDSVADTDSEKNEKYEWFGVVLKRFVFFIILWRIALNYYLHLPVSAGLSFCPPNAKPPYRNINMKRADVCVLTLSFSALKVVLEEQLSGPTVITSTG